MNQKYLAGHAEGADPVYFHATPKNIAAFIMQHRSEREVWIKTVDDHPLLNTMGAFVDRCPDIMFLLEKLQPTIIPMQEPGSVVPELKTVSAKTALAYDAPMPDWNYLYWQGVTVDDYAKMAAGEAMTEYTDQFGNIHDIDIIVGSYLQDKNLSIEMICWDDMDTAPESWGMLTVNLDGVRDKDCAFIDINNLGSSALQWIKDNDLARPTGKQQVSGYVTYPEYRFKSERLKAFDPYHYAEYLERLEKRTKQT